MLVAEIHGKAREEVRDDEDYLTSTVFGHLRYVKSSPFWCGLFQRTHSLPIAGREHTLLEYARQQGSDPTALTDVRIAFWPRHATLGIPEMAIWFNGPWPRAIVALVEVKLWAPKSGEGERDQLKRYLQITDDLGNLSADLPPDPTSVVIYLTLGDSTEELNESIAQYGDSPAARARLYQVRWQDLVDIIQETCGATTGQDALILGDVLAFLKARGLERFTGFHLPKDADTLRMGIEHFYQESPQCGGFARVEGLELARVAKGAWCNGN